MIKIRGQLGPWPVDLTLELDASDWQQLPSLLQEQLSQAVTVSAATPTMTDPQWEMALKVMQGLGSIDGPALLVELQALCGDAAAAKRLMTRLRHYPSVQVQREGEVMRWSWLDTGKG